MTTPIVFDIQGRGIRFGQTDDSVPFSVAADFAKAMGYAKTQNATDLLDADEKGHAQIVTPGGPQRLAVIYEDGMWELIFRSTLPEAKAVKARVKAILKQIRETGRYEAEPTQIGPTTVAWEQAAAIARLQYGMNVNTDELRELLTKGGILTTTGRPHKKWEHLFWPLPTRWEIHASVLPQLIMFARKIRRELALAEQDLQMSLPLPVAGLVRDLPEIGGAA
jgi:prophage antirepressor-like protein